MNHHRRSSKSYLKATRAGIEQRHRKLIRSRLFDRGLSERLCHELHRRKGENSVYVNVETGMEEQILIITEDETGVLLFKLQPPNSRKSAAERY